MKKISLLFVLCLVGLLMVVESSWAGNEINLATLSNTDRVAATPVSPKFTTAKLEPVMIRDAAVQMQDRLDFTPNQEVQKQQNSTSAASENEDNNEAGVALLAVVLILFIYISFIAGRN